MNGVDFTGRKTGWKDIAFVFFNTFFRTLGVIISGFAGIMAAFLPMYAVWQLVFLNQYIFATITLFFGLVFIWINKNLQIH